MDNNHQRQHTKHPTPSVWSLLSKAHIFSGLQPCTASPLSSTKESCYTPTMFRIEKIDSAYLKEIFMFSPKLVNTKEGLSLMEEYCENQLRLV